MTISLCNLFVAYLGRIHVFHVLTAFGYRTIIVKVAITSKRTILGNLSTSSRYGTLVWRSEGGL